MLVFTSLYLAISINLSELKLSTETETDSNRPQQTPVEVQAIPGVTSENTSIF